MHVVLKTFDVGSGDCVSLILKTENHQQYSILIDCGDMTNEVRSFIEKDLNRKIDMLILTHIDNDHLGGIPAILTEIDGLNVDKIIFNCAQECSIGDNVPKALDEAIKKDLSEIPLKSKKMPFGRQDINADKALTVAETILKNAAFRNAWKHQTEYVSVDSKPFDLPSDFGRIIFISPEKKALKKLDRKFRLEFNNRFFRKYDGPYTDEASLYEKLLRLSTSSEDPLITPIAGIKASIKSICQLAEEESKQSISDENKASIAFVWERNDNRILFCGDAAPEIMVYHFLKKTISSPGYAYFDAIKVSHHGSEHNSGSKFWETFDSKNIFLTGGNKNSRPSKVCLAKIICRPIESERTIHHPKPNNPLNWIDNNELKSHFKFAISKDTTYEFDC